MRVSHLSATRVETEKITGYGRNPVEVESTLKLAATAVNAVAHLIKDALGKTVLATGTTLPSDAETIYAKGCLFIDTDVATGTSGLYVNVGTNASCVFKLVTNAA